MRGIHSLLAAWMVSCPLLAVAQLVPLPVEEPVAALMDLRAIKGTDTSASGSIAIEISNPSTASYSSLAGSATSPSIPITTSTETIEVSLPASQTPTTSSSAPDSTTSTDDTSSSPTPSTHRRTIVIIIAVVLGVVVIVIAGIVSLLICRYRKWRTPFGHRDASPINDDEIASWRGTFQEQKLRIPPLLHQSPNREVDQIGHTPPYEWRWTATPSPTRSVLSAAALTTPNSPQFLTRAPNARAGLTDETVPGEDPFIPTARRQSSRLSKAPPGHRRTKSRTSSTSAKSTHSYNAGSSDLRPKEKVATWYDPYDPPASRYLRNTYPHSISPGPSMLESPGVAGGLSPRPISLPRPWEQDKEIGLAIGWP